MRKRTWLSCCSATALGAGLIVDFGGAISAVAQAAPFVAAFAPIVGLTVVAGAASIPCWHGAIWAWKRRPGNRLAELYGVADGLYFRIREQDSKAWRDGPRDWWASFDRDLRYLCDSVSRLGVQFPLRCDQIVIPLSANDLHRLRTWLPAFLSLARLRDVEEARKRTLQLPEEEDHGGGQDQGKGQSG